MTTETKLFTVFCDGRFVCAEWAVDSESAIDKAVGSEGRGNCEWTTETQH